MAKHSLAYRVRRKAARDRRKIKVINARLDAFGKAFKDRIQQGTR